MAITQRVELMQRLNNGTLEQAPSEYLQKTRDEVTTAIEELLEVGARIRSCEMTVEADSSIDVLATLAA
jgi:hypothetical protein